MQFGLKGLHKSAKHVEQHALAAIANDLEYFCIDQGGEDDWFFAINHQSMVDLAHRLVCFVNRIHEGHANLAKLGLKLGQYGSPKGFRCDASAVRDKKHGAIGHDFLWPLVGVSLVFLGRLAGLDAGGLSSGAAPTMRRTPPKFHHAQN